MSENICNIDPMSPPDGIPPHISPYRLFSNNNYIPPPVTSTDLLSDLNQIKDNNEDFLNDFTWLDDDGQVPELLKKRIDLLYSDNPTGCEPNNELVNALYIRWHIKKIQLY